MDDQIERWLADEIPPDLFSTPLPDEVAKVVVERLKHEADRYWSIDENYSLKYANRIVAIGQARDDMGQTALGLMARGDALKLLGNMQEAWDTLDQAGNLFQSIGDDFGWARTRIGRLYLSPQLNCVSTALADAERARAIFIRYGDQDKLLRLDWNTGLVYNYLGDQHQALKLFNSAVATAEILGPSGQEYMGRLYEIIGLTYSALGNFHLALMHYERARELATARNEILTVAKVETGIAQIYQAQGRYRSALTLLNNLLDRVTLESPFETAMTRYHMVECYLSLNRYTEAQELAQKVIMDCRIFKADYELARTLLFLATVEATLGNFAAAQAALVEAESIFTSRGAASWIATIQLWRGRISLKQGNPAVAYQESIAATSAFESDGQQVNDAAAALLQGQALFDLGEFASSAIAGKKTLNIAQHYNVPALRYAAHLLLGRVAEAQNNCHHAIRRYRAAAATIERLQRGLTITLRPGFLEDKGEALRRLITLQFKSGDPAGAFEAIERAKSQIWLDYLMNRERLHWVRDDSHSRALIEELEHLRSEHQWFYRLAHDPADSLEHPKTVNAEQTAAELMIRERRMRAITEQLYLRAEDGQKINQIAGVSLEEIQQALAEDTVLIEYYNDGEQLWAFTLDQSTIEIHRLSITNEVLNRLVRQLQANMSSALNVPPNSSSSLSLTQLARSILQGLYNLLVEPLGLQQIIKRLVIVPYGALHFLPFHLLFDGMNHLIELYEVVIMPSAGLVTRQSPKRAPGALAIVHSWENRLPYTQIEAQIVKRIFGGRIYAESAANRSVFEAKPVQILHIATHGSHRLDQPDLSFLQLADGQLYGDDVMQQDFSYELVTLSACETGRANVAASDELIGIGRSFLYAGAGALVLSLWRVSDVSTVNLMERMYTFLQAGESKAAAMREAQKSILSENRNLHPAFWGAFQIMGNADPLSTHIN